MSASPEDQASRERLADWVHQHGRAVRGYLLGVVRQPEVADDLTQEVFRKVWQARSAYQETGQARGYLLRVADRLAVDYLRRAGREVLLDEDGWNRWEPPGGELSPVEAAQQAELEAQLAAALDRLSPLQRRVLLLRYYGNLEFAEIAAALECPLSTALSHCHRGLQVLRKLMAPTEA